MDAYCIHRAYHRHPSRKHVEQIATVKVPSSSQASSDHVTARIGSRAATNPCRPPQLPPPGNVDHFEQKPHAGFWSTPNFTYTKL